MACSKRQGQNARAWALSRAQHGVVARRQLEALGYTRSAIEHRRKTGRLHLITRGVYSVGTREPSPKGRWMAAVLACGEGAFLSHRSAGALYGICEERNDVIEVSVCRFTGAQRDGIKAHRRSSSLLAAVGALQGIPITSPVQTMLDLATEQGPGTLLRTINEADKLDVIHADDLRAELGAHPGQPGVKPLRFLLDRDTFVLSDEELERRFLPIARGVGLPLPLTKEIVNGFEVDFYWPDLRFVIETDGLRYHRTAWAQAKDARRDQAHTAAGFTRLRFSHWQVRYEAAYVREILARTVAQLSGRSIRGARRSGRRVR